MLYSKMHKMLHERTFPPPYLVPGFVFRKEKAMIYVIKKDGTREEFDAQKIIAESHVEEDE